MRLKKLWLCIKSFTGGTNPSKLPKNSNIKTSENLKITISSGFSRQTKRRKLLKSKSGKEITIQPSTFTLKVACLQKQQTVWPLTMWESPRISSKRSQLSWFLQVCTKKRVISLKKCRFWIELLIRTSWVTLSKKLLTWPRSLSQITWWTWKRSGVIGSCLRNSSTKPWITSFRPTFSARQSKVR